MRSARIAAFIVGCSSLLALSACGSEEIGISKSSSYYKGAEIFHQRCAGCHTLAIAGAQGSAKKANDKEQTDGPNFDARRETEQNVLYALRNGGFSGTVMPANLATGDEAREVARFLAKYAGSNATAPAAPKREAEPDAAPDEPTTPPATAHDAIEPDATSPSTTHTVPEATSPSGETGGHSAAESQY